MSSIPTSFHRHSMLPVYWSCDHVLKTTGFPEGSGITFAGLLFGLAATPQKPLQNLGRLLVVQQCRALWKFMTCFFQTPQTHQLSVHCWTWVLIGWKIQRLTLTLADLLRGIVCVCVWIEIYDDDRDDDGILSHITASPVHLSNSSSMAHIFAPLSLNH